MITPEGHTVVEAAHIKFWRESHDDSPTNRLSLCHYGQSDSITWNGGKDKV
jgi:hypothetical protein